MSRFLNAAPQHRCFLHRSWLSQEAIGLKKGTWWQLLIMWRAHRQAGLCTCAHARAHICLLGAFSSADVPPQQADRRPPATLRHVARCWPGCSKAAELKSKVKMNGDWYTEYLSKSRQYYLMSVVRALNPGTMGTFSHRCSVLTKRHQFLLRLICNAAPRLCAQQIQ